jgi:hypothetical protein
MKKLPALTLVLFGLAPPIATAHPQPATSAALQNNGTDEAPAQETDDEAKAPKYLTAWPKPKKDEAKTLKTELARLRKAATPEMAAGGHAGIIALADVAGPALLKALGKEKSEDARERIAAALTEICGPLHTRLLAEAFDDRSEHVRLFALERAAAFPDPGIRKPAEAAFKAAEKRAGTKKEVKRELYYAALALTSSGSFDGLDELHKRALKHWGNSGHAIRAAVEALRGAEATKIIAKKLEDGDRKATVAALRLLAGCGDPESAKGIVAPFLDNTDNSIRVAAINALRGIVDGEKPLDKLPVFEAVERANKWKARL